MANVLDRSLPHVRAVIALIMNTGMDPSDAMRLTRGQIDGDVIWGNRGKSGHEIAIPIGPSLAAALDAAPNHDALTILASTRGQPWSTVDL